MTTPTTLTTADLHERLEAAVLAEEDARLALERLQAESAGRGVDPGKEERQAEADLAQAATNVQRLEAATSASTIRAGTKSGAFLKRASRNSLAAAGLPVWSLNRA